MTTVSGLYFLACSISKEELLFAVRISTVNLFGFASTTSNVCVPIDPVEPNMAMCFMFSI